MQMWIDNLILIFVSILVITWLSYGLHVVKEFIRARLK